MRGSAGCGGRETINKANRCGPCYYSIVVNAHHVTNMADTDNDAVRKQKKAEVYTIAAMRIIFTRIGCTLLTCDMYMSDLKHIHDPVLPSLKMEGIRFLTWICLTRGYYI
jgi:hypothetical protein